MLKTYSLENQSEMKQWDRFVESHPMGTPFHLSCWMRTIQDTYGFKPLLYAYKDPKNEICSILPFFIVKTLFSKSRIISVPFSDYGGPLSNDNCLEEYVFSEITKTYGGSVNYIEIRNSMDKTCGCCPQNYFKRHILNLQTELTDIKQGINKKTIQYSIRKAQKANVEIKEENNQFGIDEFYRLNRMTRKKHGVPSQPGKFFDKLFEHIILTGNGFILLAFFESKVVAASLFLKVGRQIHYKYSASDPQYLKKAYPNHLLTWHAIEKGVTEGFHSLDFGRTSPDNKGLIRYKEMWGMKSVDLNYNFYPRIQNQMSSRESSMHYRVLTKVWRSLPDWSLKKLEPMIYKHFA